MQILPPPISRNDFDKVLAKQKPTVSKGDLEVHERFTKEFGEEGWSIYRGQGQFAGLPVSYCLWDARSFQLNPPDQ